MHKYLITALAAVALASCNVRDIRAEQVAECRTAGGVYHYGEDYDDDVCVITRDRIIMFDDREVEE